MPAFTPWISKLSSGLPAFHCPRCQAFSYCMHTVNRFSPSPLHPFCGSITLGKPLVLVSVLVHMVAAYAPQGAVKPSILLHCYVLLFVSDAGPLRVSPLISLQALQPASPSTSESSLSPLLPTGSSYFLVCFRCLSSQPPSPARKFLKASNTISTST